MSFQNRLSHFQDKRRSKLTANAARLEGQYIDVILLEKYKNALQDVQTSFIKDSLFIPIILPYDSFNNLDVKVVEQGGKILTYFSSLSSESLSIYAATNKLINKDDLLFWVVEDYSYTSNPALTMEPVMVLLKVKGLKAQIGNRGIIHKTLDCTLENPSTLPSDVLALLTEAHEKRTGSFLSSHARVQQEP